jgi:hypothetical protein
LIVHDEEEDNDDDDTAAPPNEDRYPETLKELIVWLAKWFRRWRTKR